MRVAIVGGGIGGVATALFLRQAGIEAVVYEQSAELREFGAGLVVAPNMVKPLRALGLLPGLERIAVRLEAAWEFRRWDDGRVLFSQEMGAACERMYGAHCYVAHRGDLLALLQAALPPDRVRLDHRCTGVEQDGSRVTLRFSRRGGGEVVETADVAIGADGIHSTLREAIAPGVEARFSGLCAFRCLVPAERAPEMARRPVQTLWLGPGRHFVHYPVSAGRLVNIVAFVPAGDWRSESWTAAGDVADLAREFANWDPRLRALIDSVTETRRWAMYDRSPLERWTEGRVTLLGDAAHAMMPLFAQGAAQALEDACVIAARLKEADAASVPQALASYEAARRPRASEVQRMSRGREVRNHLPDGEEQRQRDAEFASGDPLRASAWLYGYEAA